MVSKRLTACVRGACPWAGMDSVWGQEKLEATLREMLENAAESHTSGADQHNYIIGRCDNTLVECKCFMILMGLYFQAGVTAL